MMKAFLSAKIYTQHFSRLVNLENCNSKNIQKVHMQTCQPISALGVHKSEAKIRVGKMPFIPKS